MPSGDLFCLNLLPVFTSPKGEAHKLSPARNEQHPTRLEDTLAHAGVVLLHAVLPRLDSTNRVISSLRLRMTHVISYVLAASS